MASKGTTGGWLSNTEAASCSSRFTLALPPTPFLGLDMPSPAQPLCRLTPQCLSAGLLQALDFNPNRNPNLA